MIRITRAPNTPAGFPEPMRATDGSAAYDLSANTVGGFRLAPGDHQAIGTGWCWEIPRGHVGLVIVRSGLGFKYGLGLRNQVGVIDEDFRGEVMVSLINRDRHHPLLILPCDRIAQMLIVPVVQAPLLVVDELGETERGGGGFGSTGV